MIIVIVLETYLIKEARALVLVLQKHMVVLRILNFQAIGYLEIMERIIRALEFLFPDVKGFGCYAYFNKMQ
jgi:hypothetical protein